MLPIETALQVQADAASDKVASLRTPVRFLLSGILGGAYIGVGLVLMVSAAGPLLAADDGLAKLVGGTVFGVALTLVVFAGADLATSAMMQLPQGVLLRRVRLGPAVGTLLGMLLANLVGALVFGALVVASGVLTPGSPGGEMLASMLATKAEESPLELLTRGILCNALVCLAVWMATRATSEVAKILLIFAAISAFVVSGFEHVVANMAAYGIGLFAGDPNATLPLFTGNVLWVGLGNLVGGGLIVGVGYWVIGGSPTTAPEAEDAADATRRARPRR